jgi:AcrR family transcriptional regulator
VLEAAGRIVAQRGIEGIRVREIASEAGLSPGAVLYHFPDQAELLFTVHSDTLTRYMAGRRAAFDPDGDPELSLLRVMQAGVPPWANEHMIRLLYELHGLARRSAPHAKLLGDLWSEEKALYEELIEAGVRTETFSPTVHRSLVAAQLLALEDGLVLHQISNNANLGPEAVVSTFMNAAATLLGATFRQETMADFPTATDTVLDV